MRILRVRLKDFRGVEDREITFAPRGVTIIEGPNEIGKTSVALGLDLIFSEYDSSTKQIIKSYRPIGRDVGPEVEVELTAGGYHVIFTKRWLRGQSTSLRIFAPSTDDLAGRPAHDRMLEILGANIDVDLWRALRFQQGKEITQASVSECPSLQDALDAASGRVEDSSGSEIELWSLVEQERKRYVTPTTGRPVADRTRLDERCAAQESVVSVLTGAVEELEESADRLGELRIRVLQLDARRTDHRAEIGDLYAKQRQIEEASTQVEHLTANVRSAESEQRLASVRLAERQRLVNAVLDAQSALDDLVADKTSQEPAIVQATQEEGDARARRDEIQEELAGARKQSAKAQADVDYFRKTVRVRLLRERIERIDDASSNSIAATGFISTCLIDQELVDQMTDVFQSVIRLRAALDAEYPPVVVSAMADLAIDVNGERTSLKKAELREMPIGRELTIVFPEVAEVRVSGGASVEERQSDLEEAMAVFEDLLRQTGITGDEPMRRAREILAERRRNEQIVEEARIVLESHLEGQTPELIKAELTTLEGEISDHEASPREGISLPSTQEQAGATRDALFQRIAELEASEKSAKSRLDTAVTALQELQITGARSSERLTQAQESLQANTEQLASARIEFVDEALNSAVETASTALVEAEEQLRIERSGLAELDPETIAGLLENAKDVSVRIDEEFELAKDDVRDIEALLTVKGDAGLHDKLEEATGALESLCRRKAQIDRQARAVERLYNVMSRHREEAKGAHVVPLKTAIERLGRYVFGPTLSVEIDRETLSILSRSIGGVAVPFDSLSGGAKEQVSLIARLACAQMVAGDDESGIPIIIDDALGNSDPDRLAALGAVIAAAGRDSQVVVLTCVPDRFSNVGAATVVSLAGA